MPLLMFPEGHRSRTGGMIAFHGGAFKLAVESGCAVLPIVVDGTLPIYQGWRVLARPGRITIRVLDALSPDEEGGNAERLRQKVFQQMKEALQEIRSAIPSPQLTAQ